MVIRYFYMLSSTISMLEALFGAVCLRIHHAISLDQEDIYVVTYIYP